MIEDNDILFLSDGDPFLEPNFKEGGVKLQGPVLVQTNSANLSAKRKDSKRKNSLEVIGPFSVGEIIGSGSFAQVRLGTNLLTGGKVALKYLKKSEILSFNAVERTANEIQCLSALRHPNIIRLETVCSSNFKYFVAMIQFIFTIAFTLIFFQYLAYGDYEILGFSIRIDEWRRFKQLFDKERSNG
jgi:serine/threonine protein kinase